jgi:hypothetical protein
MNLDEVEARIFKYHSIVDFLSVLFVLCHWVFLLGAGKSFSMFSPFFILDGTLGLDLHLQVLLACMGNAVGGL